MAQRKPVAKASGYVPVSERKQAVQEKQPENVLLSPSYDGKAVFPVGANLSKKTVLAPGPTNALSEATKRGDEVEFSPIGKEGVRSAPVVSQKGMAVETVKRSIVSQQDFESEARKQKGLTQYIETPQRTAKTIKDVASSLTIKYPSRVVASYGIESAGSAIELITGQKVEKTFTPDGALAFIIGDEPIEGASLVMDGIFTGVKDFFKARGLSDRSSSFGAGMLTPFFAAGINILDALPFYSGGKASAIKDIARTTEHGAMDRILRSLNVADDIRPGAVEKLITITDEKEVMNALESIDRLQRNTKTVEAKLKLPSKAEAPIAQEVRKYGSADDFVKAQQPTKVTIQNEELLNNNKLNIENTKRVVSDTQAEKREAYRVSNENVLRQVKEGGYIPKDATPATMVPVYRASNNGIKHGDHVTLIDGAGQKYSAEGRGPVHTKNVPLRDLVRSDGLGHEFIYSPKKITLATVKREEMKVAKRREDVARRAARRETTERLKTMYDKRISGIKTSKEILGRRREFVRAAQRQFGLSDHDIKRVTGKDIRLMSNLEFKTFLDDVLVKADKVAERRQAMNEVVQTIRDKDLKKVDNFQKSLKLPSFGEMTTEQLNHLDDSLKPFQHGDEFLSTRKLEMIDRTGLKGVRTVREARSALAKKLGVSDGELGKIGVSEFDRFRWDTSLAERNPFYKLMVESFNSSILEGDMKLFDIEKNVNRLFGRSREGTGLLNKVIPTDEKIFAYLESKDKAALAKGMTNEELEAAEYARKYLNDALAYEYQMQILKKSRYEDSYITHIRRSFFEAIKNKEYKKAFTEIFDKYKQDLAVTTILDQKTGQVLPLEKFFKFAMQRSGNLVPTKNVARAFMEYVRIFERKKALDRILPEIMTYVDILTPTELTPKGLVKDDKLAVFVKEYLNTKKGRTVQLFVKPGGKADAILQSIRSFTTFRDLAINIPVQIASIGGVQTGLYTVMGGKKLATGWKRLATPEGRKIVAQYENFTGKTPWDSLFDASKNLPEKTYNTMFSIFRSNTVRGNKVFLLGSLTDAELKAGKISSQRLAELQVELGRWLPVEGSSSILGSTTEGGILTQYKKWALPPLRTATKNLVELGGMLKNKKDPFKSREFWELYRIAVAGSVVGLTAYAVGNDSSKKDKDRSFTEKIINKVLQDSMSMVSSIDPKTYTSVPRMLTFTTDLMNALSDLIRLEKYKKSGSGYKKGDLKGLNKVKSLVVPVGVKQALPPSEKKKAPGGALF